MTKATNIEKLYVPISIIIAGVIIAGAVILTRGSDGNAVANNQEPAGNAPSLDDFRLPNKDDHTRGNPDAEVAIVEFSDFECPFCAQLHPTMSKIIEEYDNVKWIYRHFPLSQIHSKAQGAAIASECVARLGGNDSFWEFSDALFLNQRSLGQSLYESEAEKVGISASDFQDCQTDEKATEAVNDDTEEAVKSGGRGTPFSVIVTKSGELVPFSGALPYENVKSIVERALET